MAQKGQLTTSDYLPIEEFNRLCKLLRKDKEYIWELYCRVSFCTALRVSDVLALTWGDILNKEELVITERKTGKTRCIRFNESVQKMFRELYGLLERPELFRALVYNHKSRTVYTNEHINYLLKRFKAKYKLQVGHFSTHSFRKTFGRYVYERGGRTSESLLLLCDILKHGDIKTTKRYLGIRKEEISSLYDAIEF